MPSSDIGTKPNHLFISKWWIVVHNWIRHCAHPKQLVHVFYKKRMIICQTPPPVLSAF